jgi:multimeric flavodoxin WrbA
MKLFIYYGLTGNGDFIAEYLKSKEIDIRKVVVKKELPKNKFLCMMVGGFKATVGYKDKLFDFNDNIDKYDEIIIGSPIWNKRLSSPINTVLKKLNFNNKKLTFILYSASGKADKALKQIEEYKGKIIILKEPKKNKEELNKIEFD